MSDSAKKRLAIDLDEIERQLRQTAPPGAPHHSPSPRGGEAPGTKPDPLAELARIVGQDDPYRTLLSADRAGVAPARHNPDMDAVFAYGQDETVPQNRDQHQNPQSLPDWRTQWREEEKGRREDSWQDGTFERDTAHGNAGPDIHAPAGHSRDHDFDAHGDEGAAWQPPQLSAAEHDARSFQQGTPSADPTGGIPGNEDALFRTNPQVHASRHTGEDLLQPRPAPPVPPHSSQPAASAPPFAIGGFTRAGDAQGQPSHGRNPYAGQPYAPDPFGPDADGHDGAYDGAYDEDFDYDVDRSALRRRNRSGGGRKAALTLGAVLGMAVIGVASAIILVGGSGTVPDDEPPLISADNTPIRVEPANPGGMDIPEDRQIFEGAAEGETRVVDREEQPVDLEEVARQTPRVVLPPPAAAQNRAGPDPIAQVIAGDFDAGANAFESVDPSPAIAELGEPRRVSTVVVRPDGSIIRNNGESRTARPAAPAAQSDTAPMVAAAPWSVDPSGRPVSGQPEPGQSASDQSASTAETEQGQAAANEPDQPATNEPEATASTDRAETAPQEEQAAQTPPALTQPAAPMALTGALQIAPQAQRSNPAPQQTASAPASQPAPATGGDYVVQLGISNSEGRAEQAFGQFRQRYANIISDSAPIIRRAEVNGSTIYRVRVGPYSLGDANSVCDRIKNSGGDCFVARN